MDIKLFIYAVTKMLLGIIIMGFLVFIPAGTIFFFNGWLLMAVLFLPMFFAGVIMMIKKPELLKRRLNAKEQQKEQGVVKMSGLMFILGFIVAGLDYRFSWSTLPKSIITVAVLVFLLAYLLYAEVIRENDYLSRTIEVWENQKVIDTGMYSVVRHPMYLATVVLFLCMPVILGSLWSLLIFLLYPFIIAKRIKYEEEFLKKELDGYSEYMKETKYRLIPFVW